MKKRKESERQEVQNAKTFRVLARGKIPKDDTPTFKKTDNEVRLRYQSRIRQQWKSGQRMQRTESVREYEYRLSETGIDVDSTLRVEYERIRYLEQSSPYGTHDGR